MRKQGWLCRWAALLLSVMLLMSQGVALAEEKSATAKPDHITVGTTTKIGGYFFSDMWGKLASDIDVRYLCHSYNLIHWDGGIGQFAVDPSVVSGMAVMQNESGDRSYVLALYNDLYYSDGSRVTAWDYAFTILLQISPEIAQLEGIAEEKEYLLGYDAYINGEQKELAGVRVIADDMLMLTIDHAYLPFFYEMGLLSCAPAPISVIAPGVTVKDDGNGVYLANADATVTEPVYTAELLKKTLLDPETGYLYHPQLSTGPYVLTSFDGTTAEFSINPYYKGDYLGKKPTIPSITFTLADNATMVEKLKNGELDVLNRVAKAETISQAMELLPTGDFRMTNYPRTGLSYISFCCERPTVSSQAVRQAIAWCMDRDKITMDYTDGFGKRTDGYYGMGQWMVGLLEGTIARPEDSAQNAAAWDALNLDGLTQYTVDLDRARALLDKDGWELNDAGLREKDGTVLDLKLIYPAGNTIYETLETNLVANLAQVGIRLTLEPMDTTELIHVYYNQFGQERTVDMIYLGTNFDVIFDPSIQFMVGEDAVGHSYTGCNDEQLYKLALEMRQTEPSNLLRYMQKWVAFQQRFNQSLPMIPIYTNMYFDFYISQLQDYNVNETITWSEAIVGATLVSEEKADGQK